MVTVVLSLGTNMGDRRANMDSMLGRLREVLLPPVVVSRLMETEPVGVSGRQEPYLNRVVGGGWDGEPEELLDVCQAIERALGRVRPHGRAPRTADIDILLFGSQHIETARLRVPHPEIRNRRFCLVGMMEVSPTCIIPTLGKSVRECHDEMDGEVRRQIVTLPDGSHGLPARAR